jgi:hypothetical protein
VCIHCIRGTDSKYVTNGSKTVIMNVISFICVSLDGSTVQLNDSQGSRRAAHVQRLVSIVKYPSCLWSILPTNSVLLCVLLWVKGRNAKDINKEMFLFTVGSVCSVKRFHLGGKCFSEHEEVETEMRKWLRQLSKDFYAVGFDALVNRRDKCINVDGGYSEKYRVFLFRISRVLGFISICDIFIDCSSYIRDILR